MRAWWLAVAGVAAVSFAAGGLVTRTLARRHEGELERRSRIVAAAIEQNHDERGIIFPFAMAPFQVALIPIGMKKSTLVRSEVEKLHMDISDAGIEVLLDDRDDRPGVMFADMELIGIPHRIVVGERSLKEGNVEYQGRRDGQTQAVALEEVVRFIKARLAEG